MDRPIASIVEKGTGPLKEPPNARPTVHVRDHYPKPIGLKIRSIRSPSLLALSLSLARVSNPPRASDPSSSLRPSTHHLLFGKRRIKQKRKEKKKKSRIGKNFPPSLLHRSPAFSFLIHRSPLNPRVRVEAMPLIAGL